MNKKTNLAFKITNWCNLNCRHCCESSGPNEEIRFMDLDKISNYLDQFNSLPIEKYDMLAFTGGEIMSPYFHKNDTYIPQCIQIAFDGGMLPVLKTNGTWGGTKFQNKIFLSIADIAYANNKLVAIDISVDRFHNNIAHCADIINQLVRNSDFGWRIATTIQGIYHNSSRAWVDLNATLKTRGIHILMQNQKNNIVLLTDDNNIYPLYYNFNQSIASLGRARTNNLGVFTPSGRSDIFGDCVMIDNNDVLYFNNVCRRRINDQPIGYILEQIKKSRQK